LTKHSGHPNALQRLQELLVYNDDNYPLYDPRHLFNQWLVNNKTLLYVACQEGKYDIVEFFISKGLNTKIKSKADNNDFELPLHAAARWGYVNIVKLLLERGKYTSQEIKTCLAMDLLKESTAMVLRNHLKEVKKSKGCSCF
jgi:ankyrin repeat protein